MTFHTQEALRTSGTGRCAALGVLASLATACAPSDFDGLVPRGYERDPSTACDGGDPGCDSLEDAGERSAGDASSPAVDAGPPEGAAQPSPRDAGADASSCGAPAACTPMESETDSEACGNCKSGKRTRTRTCSGNCTWGAYGDFTECMGARDCAPGDTKECDPVDSCGVRRCSDDCTWDDTCVPRPGAECVRRRVYYEGDRKVVQEEGSMYMCCPGDGTWSFCQPGTCRWSDSCASCSPANCEC